MKHSVESFGDLVVCDDPPSLCPNSLQLVQHCKKKVVYLSKKCSVEQKEALSKQSIMSHGHKDICGRIWKEKVILIGCLAMSPEMRNHAADVMDRWDGQTDKRT